MPKNLYTLKLSVNGSLITNVEKEMYLGFIMTIVAMMKMILSARRLGLCMPEALCY